MAISKLPSGRLRVTVTHPTTRQRMNVAGILGLAEKTFPDTRPGRRAAQDAQTDARRKLAGGGNTMTVGEWARIWTSDPLYQRPKESTNLHNAERVRRFVATYGNLMLAQVDDDVVSAWLRQGQNVGTVSALRAMFSDAASRKAGRLVTTNPFSGLGIEKPKGNADKHPPPEGTVWALIRAAREVATPSFAAWLQVACFTGMRPGELDGLKWDDVDFGANVINVERQFNAKTRTFTLPKNGKKRPAILTPPAREALLDVPREGVFCFRPIRGEHWSPSSRAYHWKAVRAAVGYRDTLYLTTRHFAGWYMVNVLGQDSEDVAFALGHEDHGELVRTTYGHRDRDEALERVRQAYEGRSNVTPLRAVREETG